MCCLLKWMPSLSRVWMMKLWTGQKVFPEGVGTQAVLVAHHHQLVVGVLGNEGEIAEHALGEYQLLEAVNLFVLWFLNQSSIAVDEE